MGPAVHPGRSLRGREEGALVGSVPAPMLPLRRRPSGPDADAPLGPHGDLHPRPGLVPVGREPRRRQPPAPQPDRPVQRADRLHLGRRQGTAGHGVGAVPGAVPGGRRLPALRLPHRRPRARRVPVHPRQDLPDAGRPPGPAGAVSPRLPRAGGAGGTRRDGRRLAGAEAHRIRLGRAGHELPARAPRRAGADAVRRLRLSRRRAPPRGRRPASPGWAGAGGPSPRTTSRRRAGTSRRSPGRRRASATTSSASTPPPPTSTGSTTIRP